LAPRFAHAHNILKASSVSELFAPMEAPAHEWQHLALRRFANVHIRTTSAGSIAKLFIAKMGDVFSTMGHAIVWRDGTVDNFARFLFSPHYLLLPSYIIKYYTSSWLFAIGFPLLFIAIVVFCCVVCRMDLCALRRHPPPTARGRNGDRSRLIYLNRKNRKWPKI
jgi:hypothetical protein